MRINNGEFIKRVKKAFAKKPNRTTENMRLKRAAIMGEKHRLFEMHIKPLDEQLQELNRLISSTCEHPFEALNVKIEGWSSDDGEGNEWSGDTIKLTCSSCGLQREIDTSDERDGDRFSEKSTLGHVDAKVIYEEIAKEERLAAQKTWAKIQEQAEREKYLELKKRFG
jgi:hypothetical protein